MREESISTIQKALAMNLDSCKYGTIAEIGAGQEVARFFFQAGGAAGTIAKTISAYDMQFSDAIYGEENHGRYVSRSRLNKMLDKEFSLILERVQNTRSKNSTFFVFADTVAARGYRRKGECHGWVGIRMQLYPGAPPSEIIIHVRMLDNSNQDQQNALGILGVNLIYGAYFLYRNPTDLIESLVDNVGSERIEVDMIHFSGPYFEEVDNRLMALHLVDAGLTHVVMFSPEGEVLQPSDVLYKKNIMVLRGSFRPVTKVNMDMAQCGKEQFFAEDDVDEQRTVLLAEITMANLKAGGDINNSDFLARVDILGSLGFTVLISNYLRFFRLREYLNRYTNRKIGIILGVDNIRDIFNEDYYEGMEGGVLEAFGKLFAGNVRLYVYPRLDERAGSEDLITIETMKLPARVQLLLEHLVQNQDIVPLKLGNKDNLKYVSRDILRQLKKGDGPWKEGVPEVVYDAIVKNRLFGYGSE